MVDTMNALLARENVLPSLAFVPIRARPTTQAQLASARTRREERLALNAEGMRRPASHRTASRTPPGRARTTAHTTPTKGPRSRCCSNCCRAATTCWASSARAGETEERQAPFPPPRVIATLGNFQGDAANSGAQPRNLSDVRQALLAQSHKRHGEAAALSREDNDTFELLGMLYSRDPA